MAQPEPEPVAEAEPEPVAESVSMEADATIGMEADDLAYTKPSYDDSVNDARIGGDAGYEIDESELKFGLGGTFRLFGDDHDLVPWDGAAVIMQRLTSTETNDLAPGENTSSDTRFGAWLHALARLGLEHLMDRAVAVDEDRHRLL